MSWSTPLSRQSSSPTKNASPGAIGKSSPSKRNINAVQNNPAACFLNSTREPGIVVPRSLPVTPDSHVTPMFPFDAILFDVGGVLLTNGWDHRERAAVLDQFQLDRADFESRHTAPNDAWERDAITAKEYLDATVFYEPRSFSQREFLDAIFAQSKLLTDGGMGILKELAASDKCAVGVLNNEAREPNEYRFEHFGLRAYLQVAFSSCYMGLRKPGSAIYRRALDIL